MGNTLTRYWWTATISIDHPNGKDSLDPRVRVEANPDDGRDEVEELIESGAYDAISDDPDTQHAKDILKTIGVTNIDKYLMHLIASDDVEIWNVEPEEER